MQNSYDGWPPEWLRPRSSQWRRLITATGCIAALALLVLGTKYASGSFSTSVWTGTYTPDASIDRSGRNGAVSSDVERCSQMGVDILAQGGSAADAAVTTCLCIGSLEAQSSGIGGGAFITVRFPNGTTLVIDARETAPAGASKHMFDKNPMLSKVGGLASGVPGELAGLEKLWHLGGRLEWKSLVVPVVDLNRDGFARGEALKKATDGYIGYLKKEAPETLEHLRELSDWEWLLADPHGKVVKRPKLADTLQHVAHGGAASFYAANGPIAPHLADITQKAGGILTAEDIANYSVIIRETVKARFRNRTVYTAPSPASGPALVLGLHVMDELLDRPGGVAAEGDAVMLQRAVETMKWMAAARSELGDPAFVDNPNIAEITTDAWAHRVIGNVSDEHTLDSWRDYHPSYEMNEPKGTTHLSVLDSEGMAVAITSTVNLGFGNFVCDPITGVIMNSEMDDFSVPNTRNSFELAPSVYNFVEPGKRPLSSTTPSVVTSDDGGVELVIGAAGGSRILTSVFLALVRIYGFDLDGLSTVSFPRYHHQLIPEKASLELGLSSEAASALAARGHDVEVRPPATAMNLVQRRHGMMHAVSDYYRKRGLGAAY